jgi:hypothetical protein
MSILERIPRARLTCPLNMTPAQAKHLQAMAAITQHTNLQLSRMVSNTADASMYVCSITWTINTEQQVIHNITTWDEQNNHDRRVQDGWMERLSFILIGNSSMTDNHTACTVWHSLSRQKRGKGNAGEHIMCTVQDYCMELSVVCDSYSLNSSQNPLPRGSHCHQKLNSGGHTMKVCVGRRLVIRTRMDGWLRWRAC